jgi:hypothetical protein
VAARREEGQAQHYSLNQVQNRGQHADGLACST